MRTALIRAEHSERPGETIFEIWWEGAMIACMYGLNGHPGIKIVSKHPTNAAKVDPMTHIFFIEPTELA